MPIVSEKVAHSEVSKKITYIENVDFVRIRNTEMPKNLPIDLKSWQRGYYFPENIENYTKAIYDFTVRSDDVWVVSFPKCGTTWTQEMVWQICNDLNFGTSKPLSDRYSFLEIGCIWKAWHRRNTLSAAENSPSPRFIKCHLPAPLLPRQIWTVNPKIVYVARNAKDMITSYYHHWKNIPQFSGNFNDFVDLIIDDRINYTPYDSHISNFWHLRNEPNVLFLIYEEMKQNLPKVIQKTANFFGKSLTHDQICDLAEHLSFNKMASNPSVNFEAQLALIREDINATQPEKDYRFIRKGEVNSFKEEMTPEMIEKVNKWLCNRFGDFKDDKELRKIVFNEL